MFKDQYKRLKELGTGAFGSAFLVQKRDDKGILHVAKSIRLPSLSQQEREAALREAECLKKVSHPNVIAYIGCFLEEKKLHIIMEYADRGDLGQKILRRREESRPISESTILRYFVQLAGALEHIHFLNILHRDVKPMNIFLVGREEQVKLGDFGIARVLDSQTQGAQTQIGTPHYLPPEVINNEKYSTSAELWSFGVVLYELMALHVPFHGATLPAVAMRICGASPAPLPTSFSRVLRETVLELLDKEPARRPTLRHLLRQPRHDQDAWALAVQRQMEKIRRSKSEEVSGGKSEEASPAKSAESGATRETATPSRGGNVSGSDGPSTASPTSGGSGSGSDDCDKASEVSRTPSLLDLGYAGLRKEYTDNFVQRRLGSDAGESSRAEGTAGELRRSPTLLQQRELRAGSDGHLHELERARLDALQDRRVARQRALANWVGRSDDDGGSVASYETAPSRAGSTLAAGAASREKGAQDRRVEYLARASREAAEAHKQRRCFSARSSVASSESEPVLPRQPNSARSSGSKVVDFTPEYRQSLSRVSEEAAAERRRLRQKMERSPVNWLGSVPENLVACA